MVLTLHILIATLGLVTATGLFIKNSSKLILASKILAGLTLVSGTFLVIDTKASLVKACFSGLLYFGFIIFAIKRSTQKNKNIA